MVRGQAKMDGEAVGETVLALAAGGDGPPLRSGFGLWVGWFGGIGLFWRGPLKVGFF